MKAIKGFILINVIIFVLAIIVINGAIKNAPTWEKIEDATIEVAVEVNQFGKRVQDSINARNLRDTITLDTLQLESKNVE